MSGKAVVIAVDPGAKSGYAILTVEPSPRLLYFGVVKAKETSVSRVLGDVIATLVREHPDVTRIERGVIEDQFLGFAKPKVVNGRPVKTNTAIPQSMKKVARVAGRWQEAFMSHDIPYVEGDDDVHPQSWQSRELGTGSKKGRDALKKQCAEKVKGVFGLKSIPQDAADAVLIGRYRAIELATKIRQGVSIGGV